jgi:general secretion pathway protein H
MISPSNKSRGFTLIELVLVLVIMSVGLALVLTSLSKTYEKGLIRDEAGRAQQMMRYAHEQSLLKRMPYQFGLDPEQGIFWIESSQGILGEVQRLHEGHIITGEPVLFLPKGNSPGGFVTITDSSGRGYVIEVDPITGRAKTGRL